MSETAKSAPYVVAVIHKDAVEHLPVTVHAYEVPVLQQMHGIEKVQIDEAADLPTGLTEATFEPEDEFARLEQRYGFDPDTKQTYVSQAYGGLSGFMDALDTVVGDGDAVVVRKPSAKAKAAAKGKSAGAS